MANTVLKNRAACFLGPVLFPRPPMVRTSHHRIGKAVSASAKLKVQVLTIGKRSGKDAAYDAPVKEYVKRMSRTLAVSENVVKPEVALPKISELVKHDRGSVILLDEHGCLPRGSIHFSEILFEALEKGGGRLAIVIGDAEGLPRGVIELEGPKTQLLSLSPLTFTHNMVRLFLYEQLYRATEIRANTKYHK